MRLKMIEVCSAWVVYPRVYRPIPEAGRVGPAPHWTYSDNENLVATFCLYEASEQAYEAVFGLCASADPRGNVLSARSRDHEV